MFKSDQEILQKAQGNDNLLLDSDRICPGNIKVHTIFDDTKCKYVADILALGKHHLLQIHGVSEEIVTDIETGLEKIRLGLPHLGIEENDHKPFENPDDIQRFFKLGDYRQGRLVFPLDPGLQQHLMPGALQSKKVQKQVYVLHDRITKHIAKALLNALNNPAYCTLKEDNNKVYLDKSPAASAFIDAAVLSGIVSQQEIDEIVQDAAHALRKAITNKAKNYTAKADAPEV